MSGIVEVFHGTEESLVNALAAGHDLFYSFNPSLPTAIFSSDIRYSVVFAGGFGHNKEYVTTWQIPENLLLLIDTGADGSKWYSPNIKVNDLETLPLSYLKHTKYDTMEKARLAVVKNEVLFVRTPNEYFVKAEEVRTIMTRFNAK